MESRKYLLVVMLCLAFAEVSLGAAPDDVRRTPPKMRENVESLAMLGGALKICVRDAEFKKLTNDTAIDTHKLLIRLDDLVEKIANHYRDTVLQTAFDFAEHTYSESESLKMKIIARYGSHCSAKFLSEMAVQISDAERKPFH
jgi:hypothetical protein